MTALRPGLCSVTFRHLPADAVLMLAVDAGLAAVEWGADLHAPPADDPGQGTVVDLGRRTRRAGLDVCSYGSYWRAGASSDAEFDAVLSAARALETDRIRIWAGGKASADSSDADRRLVATAISRAAVRCAPHGVHLALEYHEGTLTDSAASTLALLDEVAHPTVTTYWQPPVGMAAEVAVADLGLVLDRVSAVHVFSWWPGRRRLPLADRAELWRPVLARLLATGRPYDVLLEFVADDAPRQLASDAATLLDWIMTA